MMILDGSYPSPCHCVCCDYILKTNVSMISTTDQFSSFVRAAVLVAHAASDTLFDTLPSDDSDRSVELVFVFLNQPNELNLSLNDI